VKRWINYLRGTVTLRVQGLFPERLINLCAQNRVEFWALEWLDEHTVRFTTRWETLNRLEQLAQRVDCQVEQETSRGLPDFLLRFRTRYAFLIGLTIALCAVGWLSRFVLTVEVTGNQQVPTTVILSQLRQLGVRPGVYGPSIDRRQVAQEAVLALEDLAWMGINLHGTRLEVIVRERIQAPERVEEGIYSDVVSEADGIIRRVEAEWGDALVEEGDIVAAGDTLISGLVTLEPPLYSELPNRYYQTHARGRVWARTWRTLTAQIPMYAEVKTQTGEKKTVWALELLGWRVEIFGNSSISTGFYDKITRIHPATLPGGTALPFALVREEYRAFQLEERELDREAACALLEERLLDRLTDLVGEDGSVQSTQASVREQNGMLQVTVVAECREEIGTEVPGRQELPKREEWSSS